MTKFLFFFDIRLNYRENFDKSVSRAVANLTTLAEYDLPFIKKGGQMIAMKGFEIDEELQNAEKAINILGGKIKEVNKFTLKKIISVIKY